MYKTTYLHTINLHQRFYLRYFLLTYTHYLPSPPIVIIILVITYHRHHHHHHHQHTYINERTPYRRYTTKSQVLVQYAQKRSLIMDCYLIANLFWACGQARTGDSVLSPPLRLHVAQNVEHISSLKIELRSTLRLFTVLTRGIFDVAQVAPRSIWL